MDERQRKLVANEATFRDANERIRDAATSFRFRGDQRVPFLCECSDPDCHETVMLALSDYEEIRAHPERFLLVAGHEDEDVQTERIIETERGYAVVEKLGEAGAEAARLQQHRPGRSA
jgi:hypothetical protein